MSVRNLVTCDQCGREELSESTQASGWHNVSLHDFTTGRQRQVDLCGQCWTGARIPELLP